MVLGCRNRPTDYTANRLEWVTKDALVDSVNVQERVEQALLQWRNNELDREPMLLFAILGDAGTDTPRIMPLTLCIFDEDSNVAGFGVREQNFDSKEKMHVVDEEYPVRAHLSELDGDDSGIVMELTVGVHVRDNDQRKDQVEWDAFAAGKEDIASGLGNVNDWESSLPPIWVSLPRPEKQNVLIYVIDRDGNKSSAIPLMSFVGGQ